MYGWGHGGTRKRPEGTADADRHGPSEAQIQRRRERDIAFLQEIKVAPVERLEELLSIHKGWQFIAVSRQISLRKAR